MRTERAEPRFSERRRNSRGRANRAASYGPRRRFGFVRAGFSLVELTVIILILGIIAAAAVPRLFNHYGATNENSARQSLLVVRDAIDMYRAENDGALPGGDEGSFKSKMLPFLKGPFPRCTAGNKNDNVRVVSGDSNPLSASGSEGWAYNSLTGEFIINHGDYSSY